MLNRKSLTLVTAPAVLPLTLQEAKDHLRVAHSDEDDLITAYLEAAVSHFDGRDGILNRCLIEQTWELRLDAFPYHEYASYDPVSWQAEIEIPLPPLVSVDTVKYINNSGVLTTVNSSVYQVVNGGFGRARLVEAYEQNWPTDVRNEPDAVRIQFTAGYAGPDNSSPPVAEAGIPPAILAAIRLYLGDLYNSREGMLGQREATITNPTVQRLVQPFIVSGFGA